MANEPVGSGVPLVASSPAGAGGDPGSPLPAAPAAAPPQGAPVNDKWYSGLPEDVRGYVELKGFKDAKSVVESYRNLEKLHSAGPDRLVKLPEKADDPAWKDVFKRLGAPENADGYDVKVPEGMNPDFAAWAKEQFHGLGLTKGQGEKLSEAWNARMAEMVTKGAEGIKEAKQQQISSLRQEWGASYDQNLKIALGMAGAMGLTGEQADKIAEVIGVDGLNKAMVSAATKFGLKFNEDSFISGEHGGNDFGQLSPAAARARIDELKSDPAWRESYLAGDKDARREMDRLQRNIAGIAF